MAYTPPTAGELRHSIRVRRAALVDDGHGGQERQWATVATPRAKVEGQDGREALIAHALEGISTYRLTIRHRTGLKPSDQVRLDDAGGTLLNIKSISDPDGRRRWLQILASTDGVVPEA